MKMVVLSFALALVAAPLAAMAAAAGEGGEKALRLVPKEAIATIRSSNAHAPFVFSDGDPADLDFVPHPESRRGSPSSCDGDRTLCYDPSNGHIVYKPIRNFMPHIPGFQSENISVNRHRILFKYSF